MPGLYLESCGHDRSRSAHTTFWHQLEDVVLWLFERSGHMDLSSQTISLLTSRVSLSHQALPERDLPCQELLQAQASVVFQMVLLFWYQVEQVFLENQVKPSICFFFFSYFLR